ncbi:MAG TPA: amidohydrolase family protein [Stellaceae bacterium]|nr:amidohydrolase family protein [Stellaceae bacterium]
MANHQEAVCPASRRRVLAGLSALGASALLPGAAYAAAPAAPSGRIDTHHHFFPPKYLETLAAWNEREGIAKGLQPPQRDWSVAKALEDMDKNSVSTAVLSISTPGIYFGDRGQARDMARLCNEFAAQMARDHKGRFGLFASVPMPDVDGTLREIEYALDTLKADGIGFMTSYDDLYPGDKRFAPVFEELNRRKAVAYFHPLAAPCCGHVIPGVPASVIEYPHDTTRAVVSLLFSGGLHRYQDVRFLFSHAGAAIPMLAGRITAGSRRKDLAEVAPDGVESELKKLHYDTANSVYRPTIAALLALVPASQVLFGSDFPYYTISENVANFSKLDLSAAERVAIDRGNAERLLPQLKA